MASDYHTRRPTKKRLQALYRQHGSYSAVARALGVAASTTARWFYCYGLTPPQKDCCCRHCGVTKPACFEYGRRTLCKKCKNSASGNSFFATRSQRRSMIKYAAVQAKGGCCQICGYRKNLAALQFHHLDPNDKHGGLTNLFRECAHGKKHAATLAAELNRCVLLCANCHAEHHHPDTNMPIAVSGKLLNFLATWVGEFRSLFYSDG